MLGASQNAHGQSQFGINFFGQGYHYGNTNVTATAFGIDPTNWYTTPGSGTGIGYNGKSGTNVVALPAGGSFTLAWTCANSWDAGIGDDGSGAPTPGNAEVLWGFLDDTSPGYSVTISGLRSFAGNYSIQTIAADGAATTGFPNVTLLTNGVASEVINYTNDPSQFVSFGGGVYATSTPSATYATVAGNDSIAFKPAARSGSLRSTLAAIILTYTPGNNAPLIVSQPQSVTNNLFAGDTFSLNASANGSPAFSYQWLQNGAPINGATNNTYIKNLSVTGDSGNYKLVVTNNYGSVTSLVAVVTVQPVTAPTITVAPVSQNLYQSYPATFSVSALGGKLSYQWSYNGSPIAGATNATYSIASINPSYTGTYAVAVSNPVGPTANASATLAVKIPVSGSYEDMVSQTRPDLWFRYSETGPVAQDTAANSGSLGSAAIGLYVGVTHSVTGAIVASSDKAASFNGTASIVKVPFNAALNTSTFTAEAWVKPGAVLASGTLLAPMSCGDFASPRKGWLIYQSATGWDLRAYYNNTTVVGMEVVGGTTPDTNTWYHLAVTYDGTFMTLYVNGASVGRATNTGSLYVPGIAGPFALGARADSSFYWNGSIDEVAAYGSALPANTILAHYQNGISASPSPTYSALIASASPLLYLHLNETSFTPTVAVNSGTAGTAWNGSFIDAAGTAGNPLIAIGQTGPLPPLYPGLETTNHSIAMTNGYCAAPLLPVNESVTLVSWAYLQNVATTGDLGWIGWLGNGGLYVTAGGVLHYQWPDSSASYSFASGLTIPAQTWVFTALVVSPTQTTIYMSSGTNLLSATHVFARTSGLNNTAPVGFGGNQAGRGDRNYIGGLDESAVYVRSLTPTQINAIFQAGLGTPRTLQIAPGGLIKDSKPVGTLHPGANYKTTWLASGLNFDTSVRRTGVEQFSQTNNSQITVQPDPDFNSTNGTICFWVNYNGSPTGTGTGGAMLFDRRAGTGNAGDGAIIDMSTSGGITFQAHGGTSFSSGGIVNDGDWHHVAITYGQTTNDSVSIYIDGNLDTSAVNTANWIWAPNEQIELGRSHDSYFYVYGGGMDDFRIYNRILTSSEVQSVYQSDALVDTSALKLQFNFDADPSLFGTSLNWTFGALQSSPVLGSGAVWTSITNAASPMPLQINPSIPALFYRTAFSPY